jgi:hypothetical protein
MKQPEDCHAERQIDYEEALQRVAECMAAANLRSKPHEIFKIRHETTDDHG